ncbi:MAG: SurA N-terminal domain-containing protein [Cypionkella sp.]|nr:SurA N-terminal domain-containing protein [Cypionkella sp.]
MAKDSEDTPRKKKGTGGQIVVYGLLGLLVIGLSGFGVTSFSGGATAIGSVGERDITAARYARALQSELSALSAQVGQNVPLSQAQTFGIDRQVLQTLVAQAALDNEAARAGLSVGDEAVAGLITETPAFSGTAGQFDRDTYRFVLERQNLTESEFEADLRADLARQLLTGAVAGGFVAPASAVEAFHAWIAERRGFSVLRLTEADLTTPLATATEDALRSYYEENIGRFTAPEAKRITYAALLPADIAEAQPVDEETLRRLYQDRIAEFVQPEKRLVERLVYPTAEAAAAARAALDAGTPFESLVAERGLALEDIDLGDVAREDLGAAAEAVFALTEPGVAGPVDTEFGPALFRMNAILAAQETTFDEARADLALEIQMDAARRAITDRVEAIDDLLAGGATLEDLAREENMTIDTITFVPSAPAPEGIAAYPAFRDAAAAAAEGDFAEAVLLDDGGVVSLRLDEVIPPTPIPFEEARADVEAAWRADALAVALAARAAEIRTAVEGGAALGSFGIVDRTAAIAREGFIEDAPPSLIETVFDMATGELRVVEAPGYTALVRLDEVIAADPASEDALALKDALGAQLRQAISSDALTLFSNALTNEAGITLDQTAINAVHAQFN